jgi:hypothetical protein
MFLRNIDLVIVFSFMFSHVLAAKIIEKANLTFCEYILIDPTLFFYHLKGMTHCTGGKSPEVGLNIPINLNNNQTKNTNHNLTSPSWNWKCIK